MAAAQRFHPVTPAIVESLTAIVGAEFVIGRGPDLERYARDESEDLFAMPEVAVRPASTAEISAVLALASRELVPVTPRAAGTGLSGGALPVFGGIVLSTDRMNRILEIDADNLCAVVQPAVITEQLQAEVEALGLYYPPDPASRGSCTLGGNIAENAGGPHCVKYGLTREYVLSLEAVLPDGRVMRTGGKMRKDVAGYDLTHLLVGSEGTLAVVTEATLRLIPFPRVEAARLRPLRRPRRRRAGDPRHLPRAHRAVLARADGALRARRRAGPPRSGDPGRRRRGEPARRARRQRRAARSTLELERVGEVLAEAGALDVVLADTPAKANELWRIRRCIGEAVKRIASYVECDTAVPPSRVPELLRGVRAVAARFGIRQISYGHAGDGNIHVNVLSGDADPRTREEVLRPAIDAIFDVATSLGGTITGEHGVGCVASRHLSKCRDDVAIATMRAVKHALDPLGILNPGKIFDLVPAPGVGRRPRDASARGSY